MQKTEQTFSPGSGQKSSPVCLYPPPPSKNKKQQNKQNKKQRTSQAPVLHLEATLAVHHPASLPSHRVDVGSSVHVLAEI